MIFRLTVGVSLLGQHRFEGGHGCIFVRRRGCRRHLWLRRIGVVGRLLLVVAQGGVRRHLDALVEQLRGRGYRGHGGQGTQIPHLQRGGGGGGGGGR